MAMDGPSGATGNAGTSSATGADTSQATNESVESKLNRAETATQQSQVAAEATLSAAAMTEKAIKDKDPGMATSAAMSVDSRNAEAQKAADKAAEVAADINNDPRATAAEKAAALNAAHDAAMAAGVAASTKQSIDNQMSKAGLSADVSPRLDTRYAVNTNALHQLNGIMVNGAIGTYADVALGRADA